jgi:glyoxylase-like metal-dependent hydrolase (beta-lactamase superfamily II)
MLREIADGVWVRQSEWVWTNSIVVRGDEGFGDVHRYGTNACARVATEKREQAREGAAEEAEGVPLDLVALITPLPPDGGPVPGELIEHHAHAVGHAAILLADRGVLLAGDMLSDVLVPLFDFGQTDQVGAYEEALELLADAVAQADVMVPGHGSVAEGDEVAARLAADRAYVDALRRGVEPDDPRLEQDWLRDGPHQGNLRQARG